MTRGIDILRKWLEPLGAPIPQAYLVGGAVRDHLLGRPIGDIDLMCAEPELFARRLAAVHNVTIVPFLNKPLTPCLRVVNRADAEDFIDLVPIHGGSVAADLGRRDFSINAMALELLPGGAAGGLIDPLGGQSDLKARLIRAAGARAFLEDPLRVVRAARFAAELGFDVDGRTRELMRSAAERLVGVAAERITHELFLILQTARSAGCIRMLDEAGALAAILPEILPMKGCRQNAYHHLDVWGHTLEGFERIEELLEAREEFWGPAAGRFKPYLAQGRRLALLKLGFLLHDAGKPGARAVQAGDGSATFYGHDALGASIAAAAGERLKLAAAERETLDILVRHHMHLFDLAAPGAGPKSLLRGFRRFGETMAALVLLFMADTLATRGPAASEPERERRVAWGRAALAAYYGDLKEKLERRPLITGRDLAAIGMAPGPAMGRVLGAVREAQDAGGVNTPEEALALARSLLR